MKRFECLKSVAADLTDELLVINLGWPRHEINEVRPHPGNLYVYNLGLDSSIALGLALALPARKVVALDGDGALLANLGSLATIANQSPKNLLHVVFDNEAYESSGGAPTATAGVTDLAGIASSAGYRKVARVNSVEEFRDVFVKALAVQELQFVLAKVEAEDEKEWKHPASPLDPQENKYNFIRYIEQTEHISILAAGRSYDFKPK